MSWLKKSRKEKVKTLIFVPVNCDLVYDGDCCTPENPCGPNQGDCDYDQECKNGLFCGSNNCPLFSIFADSSDCCHGEAIFTVQGLFGITQLVQFQLQECLMGRVLRR